MASVQRQQQQRLEDHNETLESISQFNNLSLDESVDEDQGMNGGDDVGESPSEEMGNKSDTTDSSINIKNSSYVESNNNSNGEETNEQKNLENEDSEDGVDDGSDNDDSANEFLNSSSFLSNSQIIRSANLNSYKPINQKTISSPTPALKSYTPNQKTISNFQAPNQHHLDSQIILMLKKKIVMIKKMKMTLICIMAIILILNKTI